MSIRLENCYYLQIKMHESIHTLISCIFILETCKETAKKSAAYFNLLSLYKERSQQIVLLIHKSLHLVMINYYSSVLQSFRPVLATLIFFNYANGLEN